MSKSSRFRFRRAEVVDIPTVGQMIQEMADYEKASHAPQLTTGDLIRDSGLDGGSEVCQIYLLDLLGEEKSQEATTIGYAVCFVCFSSWAGRIYFLEEMYVKPEYRKLGAGTRIFREVAAKAKEYGCKRFDFKVLAWNPAHEFCEKLGAINNTQLEERHLYHVREEQIEALIRQLKHC